MMDKKEDMTDRERQIEKEAYLHEYFNFACVLRGEVEHLEEIKTHIVNQYVSKGLVKLIKPTYSKERIYLLDESEWEEYNRLKRRELLSSH